MLIVNDFGKSLKNSFPHREMNFDANELNRFTGMVDFPEDLNSSTFKIIISTEVNNLKIFNTLYHELKHIFDYLNYFNYYGNIFNTPEKYDICFFNEFYI
jgi:hypothetical protein